MMVVFWILLLQISLCAASSHLCDESNWENILKTDRNGKVISGSILNMAKAVTDSKFRIYIPQLRYYADVQNARAIKGEAGVQICVQSLFHVSKSDYDKFQEDAYWWFINACTTGNVGMSRWYVGEHRQPPEKNEGGRYDIHWFVRKFADKPLYCNSHNGTKLCGSLANLKGAINNGEEIHVFSAKGHYATDVTNIIYTQTVSAQNLWHISQEISPNGTHLQFKENAYWWFTIVSTNGFRDMSRWSVGEHIDRGHTNDKVPMEWFGDTCWTLEYENDEDGKPIQGSLDRLRSSVLAGKRIRLSYSGNYLIEADDVIVWNGNVFAQVLGHVSKASNEKFQDDAYWFWQIVGTTGRVETIRIDVGSNSTRASSVWRRRCKWFVDRRPWSHIYGNSENGEQTHGNKNDFIKELQKGKMLRLKVTFGSLTYVVNADNINFNGGNTQLGAQHIRSISITTSDTDIIFQNRPYWVFMFVATTGKINRSRWTVGVHESRGRDDIRSAVDWYVS